MMRVISDRPVRGNTYIILNNYMLATAHAMLRYDEDVSKDYSFGLEEVIVSKEVKGKNNNIWMS